MSDPEKKTTVTTETVTWGFRATRGIVLGALLFLLVGGFLARLGWNLAGRIGP